MQFQKISNNSIRCVITRREMDEKGIEIDDLMDNREKAEVFLREVLDEARDAVDFRTTGNVLNVQLSVMPDGDIALVLSDDADSAIRSMLAEMKNHFQNLKAMMEQEKQDSKKVDPMLWIPEDLRADADQKNQNSADAQEVESKDDILTLPLWCSFDSMEGCMRAAKMVPNLKDVPSRLFKYEDTYYLEMVLTLTRIELAGVAIRISEYADGMYPEMDGLFEIMEHGNLIIKENAMKVLGELA